nr:unnamed protein product [Callosobruchus analis]
MGCRTPKKCETLRGKPTTLRFNPSLSYSDLYK